MEGADKEKDSTGDAARHTLPMVEITVFVQDELGLHARPAARVTRVAQDFEAEVTLIHGTMQADAKSILDILSLAVPRGATLKILCSGRDASDAAEALGNLFSRSLLGGGAA